MRLRPLFLASAVLCVTSAASAQGNVSTQASPRPGQPLRVSREASDGMATPAQSQINALSRQVGDLTARLDSLQQANAELRGQVLLLVGIVNTHATQTTQLRNQVQQLQAGQTTLSTQMQAGTSQLQAVQSGINQQYQQIQTLRTSYESHTHTFPGVIFASPGLWPEDARPNLSGTGRFLIVANPTNPHHIDLGGPVPIN